MRQLPKFLAAGLAAIGVACVATVAWAFWTGSGAGSAEASVASLPAPTDVTGSASGSVVTLSWDQGVTPDGSDVTGYHVERRPESGSSWSDACGSTASSLLAFPDHECVDTPGNGSFVYRVKAVWRSWTAQSDESDTVSVNGDTAAPNVTIVGPANAGTYNTGSFDALCSTPDADVCGTATDNSSVVEVEVSIQRSSDGRYWDGTWIDSANAVYNEASLTPASGSSVSWDYVFEPGEDTYTLLAKATDGQGNERVSDAAVFTIDDTAPQVTVEQASTQADPANTNPVAFKVDFDEIISGLTDDDFTLSGMGAAGASVNVSSGDGQYFDVTVSGVDDGTVSLSLAAAKVQDAAGNDNGASTSTDNTVTFDDTVPGVTVDKKVGQADPTNALPIDFTVQFDEAVQAATFTAADVSLSGSSAGVGSATKTISGSGPTFTVSIGNVSSSGTVVVSIPSGGVLDTAGNGNSASTSTDNSVLYDITAPTTTDNASSSWSNASSVTVTLTPTDNAGGSGVATTYYTTDGSDPTSAGSTRVAGTSVVVTNTGTTTIRYSSVDAVGNVESAKTTTVKIDRTDPTGGALTVNAVTADSYSRVTPVAWSRTNYNESASSTQSGLASSLLTVETATLSGDACGSFGSSSTLSGTSGSHAVSSGNCYRFRLTGTDNAGNSASLTRIVKMDAQAPTGSVTAPSAASTVSGNVTVTSGNAADALTGVASVQFRAGAVNIGSADTSSPYSVSWDSTTATNGSVALTAVITDLAGNTFTTAATNVTVLNTFTLVLDPSGNKTAGTAFNVDITAKDHTGATNTSFTGTKTVTFTGPSNALDETQPLYPASVNFVNGVADNVSITLYRAETKTLTVSAGGITGTSANITVAAAAAKEFALASCRISAASTPCDGTYDVGNSPGNMDAFVEVFDEWGNVPAPTAVTVNVSLASSANYSLSGAPLSITGSGSPTNRSSGRFTVTHSNNANNSVVVTVSATGFTNLTFTVQK